MDSMSAQQTRPSTFSDQQAEAVCSAWFEGTVHATRLYGEFDQNFRVQTSDGRRFILKIMRDASEATRALVGLQINMLQHLAARSLDIACPGPLRSDSGEYQVSVSDPSGAEKIAWVLTYIEGELLEEQEVYSDTLLRSLGRAVAVVDKALLDFSDPCAERDLMWNIANALALEPLTRFVTSKSQRSMLQFFLGKLREELFPLLQDRPTSVIHNDGGNQHNMIIGHGHDGAARVKGMIDFGDAVKTQTICGLGITAAYATFGWKEPVRAVARVASGYHQVLPLGQEDLDLVLWLATARLVMTVSIAAQRAADDPGNKYAAVSARPAWSVLDKLYRIDFSRATDEIRRCLHEAE